MINLRKQVISAMFCALLVVGPTDTFACKGCFDPQSGNNAQKNMIDNYLKEDKKMAKAMNSISSTIAYMYNDIENETGKINEASLRLEYLNTLSNRGVLFETQKMTKLMANLIGSIEEDIELGHDLVESEAIILGKLMEK